jgi:hypothetical protein
MKRLLVVLCAPLLLLVAMASAAHAVSPHFVRASADLDGANLVVSFKEAGLGTNQLINYTASADATATYVCVNNGGGNPSAQNKTTVSGPVTASGTFSSGKNGQVTASLTLSPPSAGGFSCPPGQDLEIAQVATRTWRSPTRRTGSRSRSPARSTPDVCCLMCEVPANDRRLKHKGPAGARTAGPLHLTMVG